MRARPGTYRRWSLAIGLTGILLSVLYVLGSVVVADQFVPPPGMLDLLADLPTRFLPPGYLGEADPSFLPQGYLATLLFEWTGTAFWAQEVATALAQAGDRVIVITCGFSEQTTVEDQDGVTIYRLPPLFHLPRHFWR